MHMTRICEAINDSLPTLQLAVLMDVQGDIIRVCCEEKVVQEVRNNGWYCLLPGAGMLIPSLSDIHMQVTSMQIHSRFYHTLQAKVPLYIGDSLQFTHIYLHSAAV